MTAWYSKFLKLNYQACRSEPTVALMNDMLSEKHTQLLEDILLQELEVKREQLTPEARLMDDLGADSLTIAEMILLLEDEFEISIPEEKWEEVKTVGQVFEAVAELLQQKSRAHL
jgi:acyl carrier protein